MSRTIKFRVWTELENCEDGRKHMDMLDHDCLLEWSLEDLLDPENGKNIPMQFTGLLDKNGKEIYEGDIIKAKVATGLGSYIESTKLWVFFNEPTASFRVQLREGIEEALWTIPKDCEVIGNIYEHPNLLKS